MTVTHVFYVPYSVLVHHRCFNKRPERVFSFRAATMAPVKKTCDKMGAEKEWGMKFTLDSCHPPAEGGFMGSVRFQEFL